ncbi:hypothetical protein KOEU_37140 [Komagataeibacter europaeus]|uniref:Uncharacterized protein n=1 Tax=Komagataeibacter europaeus TaxID=33995 RepID=A0A0M0ECW0_KOMEU|nr:hypothetical protein [Komagataeibacter europaeus]KON62796.1 hypothetical protein KOEU_37140 [Komagataeibacter europaeus]
MDNKLSELSKPVAWRFVSLKGDIVFSAIKPIRDPDGKTEQPLYSQWYVSALLAKLEAKDKRIAELDASETQLIQERDEAEIALADMYEAATGSRPEWSNFFGFADAVEEVAQVRVTAEGDEQ